jgi:DNA-directed RNA polymerase specialized sigma24 family protein
VKSRTAAEETWLDLQGLKNSVILKFQQKYGGSWDDWESEAHEIFMKAWERFNPEKGKFSTWYGFFLHKLFMEKVRRQAMFHARHQQVYTNLEGYTKPSKSFDCMAFLKDLSEDAKLVAMLVLDTPNDVKLAVLERNRNESIRNKMLDSITEFLTDLGWKEERVFSTFDEVSGALC